MIGGTGSVSGHAELIRIIRRVRRRWRLKGVLRGAAIVLAVATLVFVLSSYGLERFGFAPAAVVAFRIVSYAALLAVAVRYLVLPLARRVSDERVALYLEEHEPRLQAALVSALELGRDSPGAGPASSGALVRQVIESAVEACHEVDNGRRIETTGLRRMGAALGAAAAIALAAVLFSPPSFRHGASALLSPLGSAEAANPYRIEVFPGDVTIPRGADQDVTAQLHGFAANGAELVVHAVDGSEIQRWPMVSEAPDGEGGEPERFAFTLFALTESTDYYVEADGIRSTAFRIEVADLPYVQRLQLEYRYPAYTGRPPETVERGGDIVAPRGTEVTVRVFPTMPVAAGRIRLDEETEIELSPADGGALTGELLVEENGFYQIEFDTDGRALAGSPQYLIDVLADRPPTVSIARPGRDSRATALDEVYVEARAGDDHGVGRLELVYSVNGGEEQTVALYEASGPPLTDVSASHTFFLEEIELEPGDFISYFARVRDGNSVGEEQSATSDIYFLSIRPFDLEYRQADQQQGGAGGAGGQEDDQFSQRQREIIAATFNIDRNREQYDQARYEENLGTVAAAQGRLREQVEILLRRLSSRGMVQSDSILEVVAETLPAAVEAMTEAERILNDGRSDDALGPEQRALQQLQRAEAAYREVEVSAGQQGGGGGGGSANAEDLADLFELDTDLLENQYESIQRSGQQGANAELDETLERLRELARRQQQEVERARRQMQQGGGQGGSAAADQRALAEQTEEAARQLERLARESRNTEMMDAARRLQQAADAMRRSAANGEQAGAGEAAAALDGLEEARRRLERNRQGQLEQDIEQAASRAEALADQQRRLARELEDVAEAEGDRQRELGQDMARRTSELETGVNALQQQIDRMVTESRREQRETAGRLQEAASIIRDYRVPERIAFTRSLIGEQNVEAARGFEEEIADDLDAVADRLRSAGESVDRSGDQRLAEGLDRTRDLVRDLESLEARMRAGGEEPGEQGQGAQPGEGEQGQGGEQSGQEQEQQAGQQGQGQGQGQGQQGQGQSGQQGGEEQQAGQQGQQGQAGGQGGQGEQGQAGGQGGQDQQGQGGQQGAAPGGRLGGGGPDGARAGYGGPGGRVRDLTPEEARQFRGEFRQRLGEAQDLRRMLDEEGIDVAELDAVIEDLTELGREARYMDPVALHQLQFETIEGLRRFEFAMRRQIAPNDRERLFLSGSDDVPPGFRELVEEYYRSLSERPR